MSELAFILDRRIVIRARRSTVFAYFTDPVRFARWWGEGSTIDARPGGAVRIRYPNGVIALGEVLSLDPPRQVVFTYGYEDPAKPIPAGGSRVTVTLDEVADGTALHLRHELADERDRDQHVPGWRYQLAVFANVVADEEHAHASSHIDDLFAAWNEPDPPARRRRLETAATADVSFQDRYGCVSGRDELDAHIAAVQLHMRGTRLVRTEGGLRQCQGTALAGWQLEDADGRATSRGVNVYELAPDGRIARIVGLWD